MKDVPKTTCISRVSISVVGTATGPSHVLLDDGLGRELGGAVDRGIASEGFFVDDGGLDCDWAYCAGSVSEDVAPK